MHLPQSESVFPLRDDIQSQRVPIVNYSLIAACVLAYALQLNNSDGLVEEFGMIPARVSHPNSILTVQAQHSVQTPQGLEVTIVERQIPPSVFHPFTTLLSCVFLHGSVMHLVGNVWFLHIFGDNVEDRLGRFGYLGFCLVCGVAASFTHFAFQPESPVPTIGASGAVAGVMGAYLWLYPRAKVTTMIPIFFLLQLVVLPAPLFLGIWFVIQLVQGTFAMGSVPASGVAWWAHAGGFTFGFGIAWLFGRGAPNDRPRVRVLSAE